MEDNTTENTDRPERKVIHSGDAEGDVCWQIEETASGRPKVRFKRTYEYGGEQKVAFIYDQLDLENLGKALCAASRWFEENPEVQEDKQPKAA